MTVASESRIEVEVKKKETKTEWMKRRCREIDEFLANGEKARPKQDDLLIRSEHDLLKMICPNYGSVVWKKNVKINRKRKVSKISVSRDVVFNHRKRVEGNMIGCEKVDDHWYAGMHKITKIETRDKEGKLVGTWYDMEPILKRMTTVPKCHRCLHEDEDGVKCKYRANVFNYLGHKTNRNTKGSYAFRSMLRRVMGTEWFDSCIEVS